MNFVWLGNIPFQKLKIGMRVVSGHTYQCGEITELKWDTGRPTYYGWVRIKWDGNTRDSMFYYFGDDYSVPMIFLMSPIKD